MQKKTVFCFYQLFFCVILCVIIILAMLKYNWHWVRFHPPVCQMCYNSSRFAPFCDSHWSVSSLFGDHLLPEILQDDHPFLLLLLHHLSSALPFLLLLPCSFLFYILLASLYFLHPQCQLISKGRWWKKGSTKTSSGPPTGFSLALIFNLALS